MQLLYKIGVGECLSCGATAPDIAVYEEKKSVKIQAYCSLCFYKKPWKYNFITRTIIETIIYATNTVRMDIRNK